MYGCNLSIIDGTENEVELDHSINLPKEFSYKRYLPDVINQGNDPICVPCAISSYIDWKLNLEGGRPISRETDLFQIYGSKNGDEEGMNYKEAFSFLENEGVDVEGGNKFKIESYAKVNSYLLLRQSIIVNGPCLCALPVYNSGIDDFWNPESGHLDGYHAVSVVGYNNDGFILRNSWGYNYGMNGYSFLPLSDFNKIIELWTILN